MKKGCTKVFTSVFHDSTVPMLDNVLFFCVNKMLEEIQAGVPTFGYKVFIQLLVRSNPQAVLVKLQQVGDYPQTHFNRFNDSKVRKSTLLHQCFNWTIHFLCV